MEKANTQFADRLRAAMEAAGYEARPSVLEREYNLRCWGKAMTLHGVRRWLLGQTIPKQEKLEVLAEWLNISPQKLRFGTELEEKIEQRQSRWNEGVNHYERETFEAFLNLPPPQRKIVREVILAFATAHQKTTVNKN
jgi:transcriptional regulator with XRE-family HTH domain